MSDLRLSRVWDREIESGLPDCRVRYSDRNPVTYRQMPMDKVYCANCHRLQGMATIWTPHVFFICDACFIKSGGKAPEGTIEVGR